MKVCGDENTGCDYDCMECEIPQIEPDGCERCRISCEEDGIDYEFNVTHVSGCWTCEECKGEA